MKRNAKLWIYIKFTRFTFLICVFVNRVPRMYTFQHFLNRRTYVSTLTKKNGKKPNDSFSKTTVWHKPIYPFGLHQNLFSKALAAVVYSVSCSRVPMVSKKKEQQLNKMQQNRNNVKRLSSVYVRSSYIFFCVFYTIRGVALKVNHMVFVR